MNNKTVPFSARISMEDVEFIGQLEYEGASTPSEKLRLLLAEVRREKELRANYAHNLALAQQSLSKMKQQLLISQQQIGYTPEVGLRILDALPDLLASLQTWAAQADKLSAQAMQTAELQLLPKVFRLNELILPLLVSGRPEYKQQADSLTALLQLLHNYLIEKQGEKHE